MSRLLRYLALLCLLLPLSAGAINQPRVATDAEGRPLRVEGRIALIEPDIELSLVTAGGLTEPRREWSEAARRLFPESTRRLLAESGRAEGYLIDLADDLEPASRLGQVLRLNRAVAMSIAAYSMPGSQLATKGRRLDWSLGDGVAELRAQSGADYGLFVFIRDSYASAGRNALRVFGFLAGAAMGSYLDIGGGQQLGVATLVDLRSGQVVWFNLMSNQSGDLRDAEGADRTVRQMLKGLPL